MPLDSYQETLVVESLGLVMESLVAVVMESLVVDWSAGWFKYTDKKGRS